MQNKFTDNLLKGFIEFSNNATLLKPILQPLSIWPETNFMLDEFYLRPDISIARRLGLDPTFVTVFLKTKLLNELE